MLYRSSVGEKSAIFNVGDRVVGESMSEGFGSIAAHAHIVLQLLVGGQGQVGTRVGEHGDDITRVQQSHLHRQTGRHSLRNGTATTQSRTKYCLNRGVKS